MPECASIELSEPVRRAWRTLIDPLLVRLDAQMDCRLVETLAQTVRALIQHRHRACGLLLSELGGVLLSPEHAPAGTKRLSNLLRSSKWSGDDVAHYLWQKAQEQVHDWQQAGEEVLALWDHSVLEKPESRYAQGLCPVRSSKASRLSRIKPGYYRRYYRPPGAPVFVPGWNWMALLFIASSGPPCVGALRWWGTRSVAPERGEPWLRDGRQLQRELLTRCQETIGDSVLHLFDRGFAGAPWLSELHQAKARFVVRWPKHYKLSTATTLTNDSLKAWQHLRGKRSWDHQLVPDARRGQMRKVGVVATQVFHPAYGQGQEPLWLVAARSGGGREPWYLLTNEPVEDAKAAWRIVRAYARRWQIEMSFRFQKSELAMESLRLWCFERRVKLLMLVTLAYALLLALLRLPREWLNQLLREGCHRTGKRSRDTPTPLARLRQALAHLFLGHPPDFAHYKSPG